MNTMESFIGSFGELIEENIRNGFKKKMNRSLDELMCNSYCLMCGIPLTYNYGIVNDGNTIPSCRKYKFCDFSCERAYDDGSPYAYPLPMEKKTRVSK